VKKKKLITSEVKIVWEESIRIPDKGPVEKAAACLKRDLNMVLLDTFDRDNKDKVERIDAILLAMADTKNKDDKSIQPLLPEGYDIQTEGENLVIYASDMLGFVYGIYAISKKILGVLDFWFWNDQCFEKKSGIEIDSDFSLRSVPMKVKYRGWFVNDEVLIADWNIDQNRTRPWEMVFEALLRCGGNMVIPGTDRNAHQYRAVASAMGLMITHHHAEPLGATMFARAYTHLNASYKEYPELFHKLWKDGIDRQKDMQVIWNLGFRGQGDCPFWANDPAYDTDELRGALMGELIRKQYDMVKQEIPDAICCSNLYGETMELYQKGFLNLPDDVIRIWADNGYGRMVSRRQGNHNPRVLSLPDGKGAHGIYYHASFYDLQAANHITMLTNSFEFIQRELLNVFEANADDFWLINCSNVKPHVFSLALIAAMWREKDIDLDQFRLSYVCAYYGKKYADKIAKCFVRYAECALPYGELEDEHAAEQFTNHGTRIFATQWMKDRGAAAREMLWAVNKESLSEQIAWYKEKCEKAESAYRSFVSQCDLISNEMEGNEEARAGRRLFDDSIRLHGQIHALCCLGAVEFGTGYSCFEQGNHKRAFYHVGLAAKAYEKADWQMRQCEHGKWSGYYKNECLTDIKQTVWVLEGLMAWIRTIDDGPHFYRWQREFFYSEDDKRVQLILNMENHMTDKEIFALMKKRWEE